MGETGSQKKQPTQAPQSSEVGQEAAQFNSRVHSDRQALVPRCQGMFPDLAQQPCVYLLNKP